MKHHTVPHKYVHILRVSEKLKVNKGCGSIGLTAQLADLCLRGSMEKEGWGRRWKTLLLLKTALTH